MNEPPCVEEEVNPPTFTFNDVPDQLVQMIFAHINYSDLNCLRATSKRLRYLVDDFILHEFKKELQRSSSYEPNGHKCAVLQTIKFATEAYVESGLEPIYTNCLIPMLCSTQKDPFSPSTQKVTGFLTRFYHMVEEVVGSITLSQRSQLLFDLTLMKLIKHFSKMTIIYYGVIMQSWETILEVEGPWFGKFVSTNSLAGNPSDLLVIMAELLIADKTGACYQYAYLRSGGFYTLGNETDNSKHLTKIVFTLTVNGSNWILRFLRSCLETEECPVICPAKLPEFKTNLDIICHGVPPWEACEESLEFGSFVNTLLTDERDSYDEGEEELTEGEEDEVDNLE